MPASFFLLPPSLQALLHDIVSHFANIPSTLPLAPYMKSGTSQMCDGVQEHNLAVCSTSMVPPPPEPVMPERSGLHSRKCPGPFGLCWPTCRAAVSGGRGLLWAGLCAPLLGGATPPSRPVGGSQPHGVQGHPVHHPGGRHGGPPEPVRLPCARGRRQGVRR